MNAATLRSPFVVLLALLIGHATGAARPATAAPGVCDRLCSNVPFNRLCSATGDQYIQWRWVSCTYCDNSNSTECIDGKDVSCAFVEGAKGSQQWITFSPKGVGECTCNRPFVNATQAKSYDGEVNWVKDVTWKTCGGKDPYE